MNHRRLIVVGAVGSAALFLAGCANKPLRAANADGSYCFRVNSKSRRKTCTPEPVPGDAVDAQAKEFQADAGALTVYVVRKRWADAVNVVDLSLDGQRVASTLKSATSNPVENAFRRRGWLRIATSAHDHRPQQVCRLGSASAEPA